MSEEGPNDDLVAQAIEVISHATPEVQAAAARMTPERMKELLMMVRQNRGDLRELVRGYFAGAMQSDALGQALGNVIPECRGIVIMVATESGVHLDCVLDDTLDDNRAKLVRSVADAMAAVITSSTEVNQDGGLS